MQKHLQSAAAVSCIWKCIFKSIKVKKEYVEIKCQLDATDDFYCRFYCLLNMFRAPLCPSSGAREYHTSGCCLSYLVLWFSSCRYGVELRVVCPVCGKPNTTGSNHLYDTLELLMMGIMVPKTCWASNNICNKNHLLHPVGILFTHINDDAQSKPHQMKKEYSHTWLRVGTVFTRNIVLFCIMRKVIFYIGY